MSKPLISVLVPAYRAKATLPGCLRALLAGGNAGVAMEILVEPDDGQSYADLAQLSSVVQVAAPGPVRSGPGAARNRALARARGDWVTYVDADDHVAPDYLPVLLQAAMGPGGAVAVTRIVEAEVEIARLGRPGAVLDFPEMARHGASFRGLARRDIYPAFADDLSQDILHMAELLLILGPLPFAATDYALRLEGGSVTQGDGFSSRVDAAYLRNAERILARYPDAPLRDEAVALMVAKRALNARYVAEGLPGESYYRFVARVVG
jgi:glycosyltransferase involved in cell wall biosynthesis